MSDETIQPDPKTSHQPVILQARPVGDGPKWWPKYQVKLPTSEVVTHEEWATIDPQDPPSWSLVKLVGPLRPRDSARILDEERERFMIDDERAANYGQAIIDECEDEEDAERPPGMSPEDFEQYLDDLMAAVADDRPVSFFYFLHMLEDIWLDNYSEDPWQWEFRTVEV